MIAIFKTQIEAQAYADKVHLYLSENCPNYSASKWADPEMSADGLMWMVQQPKEEHIKLWDVAIDTAAEKSNADITLSLPESGTCEEGKFYLYKGSILRCRQTHQRTIYDPKDTPALFSFFRDNTDQLLWIEGEQVSVGWMRIYNAVKYEVIQAHQTQSDWTPDKTPTLWKVYTEESIEEYKVWSASDHWTTYTLGDKRIDAGKVWECINVGFSYYQPSSVNGHYGWKYLKDV